MALMQYATSDREIRHPQKGDRVRLDGDGSEVFVVFHVSDAAQVVTLKSVAGNRFLQVIPWSELCYCGEAENPFHAARTGLRSATIRIQGLAFICASRKASTSSPHTSIAEEQNPQCPSCGLFP